MAETPHFAFPFARGNVVEQHSEIHVMSCVNMVVRCPIGFRIERPDFGIPWQDYKQRVISGGVLQQAMREQEDRARITADVVRDGLGNATIEVEVETN